MKHKASRGRRDKTSVNFEPLFLEESRRYSRGKERGKVKGSLEEKGRGN